MSKHTITVYAKPRCVQCDATKRHLDRSGADYTVIDLTTNPDALTDLQARGFTQAPVVNIDDDWFTGFRPDRLNAAVTAD